MDKKNLDLIRLHESAQLPNLVFSDEMPFQTEQFVSKQNDRVYLPKRSAENLHLRLATRTQVPPMVIAWAAVTADGHCPLVFIDRGVKINTEYYRENVLRTVLKPWADKFPVKLSFKIQKSLKFLQNLPNTRHINVKIITHIIIILLNDQLN